MIRRPSSLVTKRLDGRRADDSIRAWRSPRSNREERRKSAPSATQATGAGGEIAGAAILVTAGRVANVEGLNLEAIGIHADPAHGIEVDEYLQTHSTRVYAVGDVLMKHFSAHVALQEATVAFQNAVLRIRKKMDYATIPWATFTDPEVAGVGITEAQAKADETSLPRLSTRFGQVDRAVIDG